MPRDEGLDWYGGERPDPGPGGLVDAVGINHAPPALAIDPEATVADPGPAERHPAGPALRVERMDRPDQTTRPRGRVRMRST